MGNFRLNRVNGRWDRPKVGTQCELFPSEFCSGPSLDLAVVDSHHHELCELKDLDKEDFSEPQAIH